MGKETGILLNASTNDLDIQVKRDSSGKITQGIHLGETTYQNIGLILKMQPGELKEKPMIGVGIDNLLLDKDLLLYKHRITEQLDLDGLKIKKLNLTTTKIDIDAKYV